MKKKEFFKNLGTILIYAFLGTFISIFFSGIVFWGFGVIGIYQVINIEILILAI